MRESKTREKSGVRRMRGVRRVRGSGDPTHLLQ